MRHDSHYVEELTKTHRTVGRTIPIDKLIPNPDQPRVEIGDLAELTSSIQQKGVLEPILVKPQTETGTWLIIAGERRWRAANLAGLQEVPCIELDLTDREIAEIALIENLQRKDLTIWEVADGLAFLADKFGYTHEQIANRIGKSRTTVTESLTIAGLPEPVRRQCREAGLSAKSVLLEVARQFDEPAMHRFIEQISADNLSRSEIRRKARPAGAKGLENPGDQSKSSFPKTAPKTAGNIFRYFSKENGFEINIHFLENNNFRRKDVLKALKEVFDDVKARRTDSAE
jgi:ParB family chromosome partitioning protein